MKYEELCSGNTVKEHQKDYERSSTVKETPKHGRKVEYNQEAIDTCRKNSASWFVLATNDVKDPVGALEIYRMKEAGWFKSHNMQEVIDEMKSLRAVSIEGKRKQIYTTMTAFQKEIVELFGLNIG